MTRRSWIMSFVALPVVRATCALDLVKVTVRSDGREYVRWEPRAVAVRRFANVEALLFAKNTPSFITADPVAS